MRAFQAEGPAWETLGGGWGERGERCCCCADIMRAVQWGRGSGVGGEGGGGCVASEILNHTGAHGFLRGSREAGPVMLVLWERSTWARVESGPNFR